MTISPTDLRRLNISAAIGHVHVSFSFLHRIWARWRSFSQADFAFSFCKVIYLGMEGWLRIHLPNHVVVACWGACGCGCMHGKESNVVICPVSVERGRGNNRPWHRSVRNSPLTYLVAHSAISFILCQQQQHSSSFLRSHGAPS